MLPKAEGGASVAELAQRLTARGNATAQILAIATETPAAMFRSAPMAGAKRLARADLGGGGSARGDRRGDQSREEDGRYTPPYELARSLCLFGAAAAGVAPIETVYPAFKDLDGLAAYAARARRDGFTGMMAIHPDQIGPINAAFTPSEAEMAHAQAVVAAFEANPEAGALSLDGRMIDRPHLVQAQRILAAAARNCSGKQFSRESSVRRISVTKDCVIRHKGVTFARFSGENADEAPGPCRLQGIALSASATALSAQAVEAGL